MIKIIYKGGYGNKLFQYAFAKLHACFNCIQICNLSLSKLPFTINDIEVLEWNDKDVIYITDDTYLKHRKINGSTIMSLDPTKNYIFNGFFQDADLYNRNKDLIKTFFTLNINARTKARALINIRLGDFIHNVGSSEIIHYEWYLEVLNKIPLCKDLLVSHYQKPNNVNYDNYATLYLNQIKKAHNVNELYLDTLESNFLAFFEYQTIVCSNSTFAWWAAFLCDAGNIYTFKKWGKFGECVIKSHGDFIHNLENIKDISTVVDGNFINIFNIAG